MHLLAPSKRAAAPFGLGEEKVGKDQSLSAAPKTVWSDTGLAPITPAAREITSHSQRACNALHASWSGEDLLHGLDAHQCEDQIVSCTKPALRIWPRMSLFLLLFLLFFSSSSFFCYLAAGGECPHGMLGGLGLL